MQKKQSVWRDILSFGQMCWNEVKRRFATPLWRFVAGKDDPETPRQIESSTDERVQQPLENVAVTPDASTRTSQVNSTQNADRKMAAAPITPVNETAQETSGAKNSAQTPEADNPEALLEQFYGRQGARDKRRRNRQQQEKEENLKKQMLFSFDTEEASKKKPAEKKDTGAVSAPAEAVVQGEENKDPQEEKRDYELPPEDFLTVAPTATALTPEEEAEIKEKKIKIQNKLDSFHLDVEVGEAIHGPRITMYTLFPGPQVRAADIPGYSSELQMELETVSLRIQAPVPGKNYVGIEVPNKHAEPVFCGDVVRSQAWRESKYKLPIALGKDIEGKPVIADLAKAPHLLVAGATSSGKSVGLNTMIVSLLMRFTPDELKMILVDPKVVELQPYNVLPHLLVPVITECSLAELALRWAVTEMEVRYRQLAAAGGDCRDIGAFNARHIPPEPVLDKDGVPIPDKMPYLVIVLDEFGDLMLNSQKEVETCIIKLAQKSRAVGIHLILATQRPSVDVITGVIKANLPARLSYKTSSSIDSRTILDNDAGPRGAECLLGQGDALYHSSSAPGVLRLQGAMVPQDDMNRVLEFWGKQASKKDTKAFDILKTAEKEEEGEQKSKPDNMADEGENDEREELLCQAVSLILEDKKTSISYLQRRLSIGYNKAAGLVDELEERGFLGPAPRSGSREILMDSLEEYLAHKSAANEGM